MSVTLFLSIALGFTTVGLLAGSFIGEEYLGNAEPMIEMLFDGLVGIGIGGGIGLVSAVWLYKKIGQVSKKKGLAIRLPWDGSGGTD